MSSHTIRNDIRVLELEYPIDTRMGAGGGVFILDSSRLQQRWLTVRQRELLMDVCGALNSERTDSVSRLLYLGDYNRIAAWGTVRPVMAGHNRCL